MSHRWKQQCSSPQQHRFITASQHSFICNTLRHGSVDAVQHLLQSKSLFVNSLLLDGQLPLQIAVDANRPEMVEFLLDKGANVNKFDQAGWTALHHAVYKSNIRLAKKLLERGADPSASRDGDLLPIEMAMTCDEDIIHLLRKAEVRRRQSESDQEEQPWYGLALDDMPSSEDDCTRYELIRSPSFHGRL